MNSRFFVVAALRCWLLLIIAAALVASPAFAQVNVLTQRNDNSRTGANLNETILTPQNVGGGNFGMLFKRTVDDQVYGQPLVVTNVSIGGGTHNVVIITTVHNSVYAFDADNGTLYWHKTQTDTGFGAPVPFTGHFTCTDMTGNMNIVVTPVIDANTNTLYVVSLSPSGTSFVDHLHALDLSTGAEKFGGPVTITAPEFVALNQNQRPALLLANGNIYVGYSSHCDQQTYHGFLIAYNAGTLQQIGVFNSSPNTSGKGNSIWHSGTGPAADASGNIYVVTGNGSWDGVTRFSETFFKLSPTLQVIDWFTPHDHATLDSADADVNSGSPLLIPGTHLLVGGGKGAKLYLIDTNNFGHLGDSTDSQIVQSFQTGTFGKNHLHNLVFWTSAVNGPMLYTWPQADQFKVYKFNGSTFNSSPFMIQPTPNTGHPGGMLSISANGNTNGIVWAAIMASGDAWHQSQPGVLHAFDADNINNERWNSLQNSARDNCNNYSKMAPPTIANGKVYLASFGTANAGSGQFCVYGLLNNTNPDFTITPTPTSRTVTAGGSTTYTIALAPSNGFTGNVALSISGLPAGSNGTFNPTSLTTSGSSTLTVTTSTSTPTGTYTLTVHGDGTTISHTTTVTLTVNPITTLPPGWNSTDVGTPGMAGSASFNNGTFTVSGSGADIWSTADNFQYAYQSVTGDQTITARVASQQNTNVWAKAGVMIRQSTAANSAYVFVMITPGNGVNMQYRPTNGGTSVQLAQQLGHAAPYWVRLVRSGNTFTGFSSADGTTWAQVGTISVTMSSGVTAGMAVCAHNNTALSAVTFDSVSITAPVSTPDFTLSASPASQTISPGGSTNYTVSVGAVNGFNGSVALSVSAPAAVTTSLNPASVTGSGSAALSAGSTAAGSSTLTVTGTSGSLSHSTTVALNVQSACATASTTWQNAAFPTQTGTFTATFDGTPAAAGINSVMALSSAAGSGYANFAAIARFNSTNGIDARDAGAYNTPSPAIPYVAGSTYHFRLVINVPAHTYSAFVTPPSGTEQTIGTNLAFRTEQNTVTSLANFGVYAGSGSNTVCSFAVQ
jgi:regulation of enolase protein 1 (concanavalin A-like superfamily)